MVPRERTACGLMKHAPVMPISPLKWPCGAHLQEWPTLHAERVGGNLDEGSASGAPGRQGVGNGRVGHVNVAVLRIELDPEEPCQHVSGPRVPEVEVAMGTHHQRVVDRPDRVGRAAEVGDLAQPDQCLEGDGTREVAIVDDAVVVPLPLPF